MRRLCNGNATADLPGRNAAKQEIPCVLHEINKLPIVLRVLTDGYAARLALVHPEHNRAGVRSAVDNVAENGAVLSKVPPKMLVSA